MSVEVGATTGSDTSAMRSMGSASPAFIVLLEQDMTVPRSAMIGVSHSRIVRD